LDGLRDYHSGRPFSKPFGDAWAALGLHEDISDDLAAIFDVLQIWEQAEFRAAIAIAFQNLDLEKDQDLYVARRLLLLAGKVDATAVLEVLGPTVLANDALPHTDAGDELRFIASDLAISLASPGYSSRVCLAYLLKYQSYDLEKTRPLFLALCKTDPLALTRHLNDLGQQLIDLFEPDDENFAVASAELFLDTATAVPIQTMAYSVYNIGSYDEGVYDWWSSIPDRPVGASHLDLPMASLSAALQRQNEREAFAWAIESMTPAQETSVRRQSKGILQEVGLAMEEEA
jgi:hypothetical protein